VQQFVPPESLEDQWDVEGLVAVLDSEFSLQVPITEWLKSDSSLDSEGLVDKVIKFADEGYREKFSAVEASLVHQYERAVMLQSIDTHWREHLAALDYLRQGIHLRGYAAKQPKQEYKREAFELFSGLLDQVKRQVTQMLMSVQVASREEVEAAERAAEEAAQAVKNVQYHHANPDEPEPLADGAPVEATAEQPYIRAVEKVGRNDPCWCGSGKKFKHCHGKLS
jgi:preprotein translocase subunit SecA